jgi:hypothetical protein
VLLVRVLLWSSGRQYDLNTLIVPSDAHPPA